MSKLLIWTLLELTTFLFLLSLVFLLLSHSLNKKIKDLQEKKDNEENAVELSKKEKAIKSYKRLAHFLDKQISFAVNAIRPNTEDHHETNTIKLWGTILRAERAIILNQADQKPTPILIRFLSSLLYALSSPKLQMADADKLHQTLKELEAEIFQTTELLVVKESLTINQVLLNEDLRDSMDRANRRLAQLRAKQKEQQRLKLEVCELQKKIKKLEQSQIDDLNIKLKITPPHAQELNKDNRNTAFKQISALHHLSDRQEIVIEQLKNEMKKVSSNKSPHDLVETQKVAIAKMERMSEETQTLVIQLETELQTYNFSIDSLRENISIQDARLAEVEKQLSSSNETAIGNLKTLNTNKKETLSSLRDYLSTELENRSSVSLIEQEKDIKMLERLLQESETCVVLLAQELDAAEEKNQELKQEVEISMVSNSESNLGHSQLLNELRKTNRELAQTTVELKNKILDMSSAKDHQELRIIYSKKTLEYNRLELASSDLEMKFLGTLK
ncbi:hypothetical protein MUS1_09605 [Marinomonas ushuaiensis DSM 15871]|uniref:Uncharacterized protein n=1 Tax=Marinomonas ushuaiensis DSM 15871 TaxID=1122207 RepID=X7E8K2_9GAMM|nr:hypothetical protein [Marinomonas ushuaiensis]ETX11521.1 hypothetical protein MUS1_09605 [Marinomonas ushuaiensis DSM 15871]